MHLLANVARANGSKISVIYTIVAKRSCRSVAPGARSTTESVRRRIESQTRAARPNTSFCTVARSCECFSYCGKLPSPLSLSPPLRFSSICVSRHSNEHLRQGLARRENAKSSLDPLVFRARQPRAKPDLTFVCCTARWRMSE